jgi:hypothetical protein
VIELLEYDKDYACNLLQRGQSVANSSRGIQLVFALLNLSPQGFFFLQARVFKVWAMGQGTLF